MADYEPITIFEEAEAFRLASEELLDLTFKEVKEIGILRQRIFAVIHVNHAFAFELYLKCLLTIEDKKFVKIHDLPKLFRLLKKETQDKIISYHDDDSWYTGRYKMYEMAFKRDYKFDFLSLLNVSKEPFYNLRYAFEGHEQKEYIIQFAMSAVRKLIMEIRPDFFPTIFPLR